MRQHFLFLTLVDSLMSDVSINLKKALSITPKRSGQNIDVKIWCRSLGWRIFRGEEENIKLDFQENRIFNLSSK